MEERETNIDPPILHYQSPNPWPLAPPYSMLVSLIPHACVVVFAKVQTGMPDLLVHIIVVFAFISSPVFSVLAIRYYLKRRMTWVAILGLIVHSIWGVLFLNVVVGIFISIH